MEITPEQVSTWLGFNTASSNKEWINLPITNYMEVIQYVHSMIPQHYAITKREINRLFKTEHTVKLMAYLYFTTCSAHALLKNSIQLNIFSMMLEIFNDLPDKCVVIAPGDSPTKIIYLMKLFFEETEGHFKCIVDDKISIKEIKFIQFPYSKPVLLTSLKQIENESWFNSDSNNEILKFNIELTEDRDSLTLNTNIKKVDDYLHPYFEKAKVSATDNLVYLDYFANECTFKSVSESLDRFFTTRDIPHNICLNEEGTEQKLIKMDIHQYIKAFQTFNGYMMRYIISDAEYTNSRYYNRKSLSTKDKMGKDEYNNMFRFNCFIAYNYICAKRFLMQKDCIVSKLREILQHLPKCKIGDSMQDYLVSNNDYSKLWIKYYDIYTNTIKTKLVYCLPYNFFDYKKGSNHILNRTLYFEKAKPKDITGRKIKVVDNYREVYTRPQDFEEAKDVKIYDILTKCLMSVCQAV